ACLCDYDINTMGVQRYISGGPEATPRVSSRLHLARGLSELPLKDLMVQFILGGRQTIARAVQPAVVVPVDPLQGRKLDVSERLPRPAAIDDLGLVEADRCLRESIVVGVADAPDRRVDAGIDEALGERERCVLTGLNRSSQQCSCSDRSRNDYQVSETAFFLSAADDPGTGVVHHLDLVAGGEACSARARSA